MSDSEIPDRAILQMCPACMPDDSVFERACIPHENHVHTHVAEYIKTSLYGNLWWRHYWCQVALCCMEEKLRAALRPPVVINEEACLEVRLTPKEASKLYALVGCVEGHDHDAVSARGKLSDALGESGAYKHYQVEIGFLRLIDMDWLGEDEEQTDE